MKNKVPGELNAIISKNIVKMMNYTGDTVRHIKEETHINIEYHKSGLHDMHVTTLEAISKYFFLEYGELEKKEFNPETAKYVDGGKENLYMKKQSRMAASEQC
jgi:hypothetical protein